MTEYIEVSDIGEIPPGERKCVEVRGELIALFNLDGELLPFMTAARTKKPSRWYGEY